MLRLTGYWQMAGWLANHAAIIVALCGGQSRFRLLENSYVALLEL